MEIRVGHGFDVHKFSEDRKLILCGVEVPYELGLLGHSDADVATHALMDALLGAVALGDIGKHFPDTDEAYCGADSLELLKRVMLLVKRKGFFVSNVDITIIAQKPKLMKYIPEMVKKIALTIGISFDRVNVKATTTEKLGFTGRGEGVAAEAVCLIGKE